MMGYYKLSSACKENFAFTSSQVVSGQIRHRREVIMRGTEYETPTNEVAINSLKTAEHSQSYDEETLEILKEEGIEYEVHKRSCCGGRKKKIYFNPVIFY